MDDNLIDAYAHQHQQGFRVNGTFTVTALENIPKEVKQKFPDQPIDKEKVKPEVAAWMNKPIRNYEKLCLLYGNDRATGKHAETAAEMRQRRAREGETNASHVNNIDDVDFLISENEVTLENFNGPFKEAQNIASEEPIGMERSQSHSQSENSLRNKTAKRSKVDEEVVVLKEGLDNVAQALMNSTIEFVKATKLPISENETWTLLEELGVESHLLSTCYLFFIQKPDMLRGLLGCPPAFRKNLLMQMMGGSNASQN
ncbi:hypothetical protein GH714_005961 [Hevea brasiliensis]|uniref:Uncharacterized protein n=1 Tax=Hevea brasiliensis TaxID=3981 RepID=A0A6A6NC20_HEVBR|nr:hypothetical protein GH714_005961 [Hevea brasiliensis]